MSETPFLDKDGLEQLWETSKSKFVSESYKATIKQMVKTSLKEVEGVYPSLTFPFSNESLTENKIVMSTQIKIK